MKPFIKTANSRFKKIGVVDNFMGLHYLSFETSDGMKISFIEFKYIPDLTESNSVSIRFNKRYFRKNYEFDVQGIDYAMEKSEQICNMAQDIINSKNFKQI